MEQPTVDCVARALAEGLDGAGSAAVAGYLGESTLLHMPGASGFSGDYQGSDAIRGLLDRLSAASRGTLRFETVRITHGRDGRVRLWGKVSGRQRQRVLAMTATLEVFVEGSTLREAWLSSADEKAWDEFWS